jgi:hypothetical protein
MLYILLAAFTRIIQSFLMSLFFTCNICYEKVFHNQPDKKQSKETYLPVTIRILLCLKYPMKSHCEAPIGSPSKAFGAFDNLLVSLIGHSSQWR